MGFQTIFVVQVNFEEAEEPMEPTVALAERNQEKEQRSLLRIFAGTVQHFWG
jgi:hypothetical protein